MQRKENESFAAYKERRAESNLAVKQLNAQSKGGSIGARANFRASREHSRFAGAYGKAITASFSEKRVTVARLATHSKHLAHMASRTAARLLRETPLPLAA